MPRLLIREIRVPTADGPEYPSPMSFNCQSSLGPPAGHCLSRPLSFEIPSRSGPRHWGQSELPVWDFVTDTVEKHKKSAATVVNNLEAISSPSVQRKWK